MNIPNFLTILRILVFPVFVLVFYLPFPGHHAVSALLFALACLTDWLDGYLARIWQQTSAFGAFLDPVADKVIVSCTLVLVVAEKHMPFLAIPAAIIVGREVVISGLREWMAELGKRASIAVSYVTKVKTALQMFAIFLLLLYKPGYSLIIGVTGYLLLYIAAILTLYTMIMYLKTAWPSLVGTSQEKP